MVLVDNFLSYYYFYSKGDMNMRLDEMSFEKNQAVDIAVELGEQFAKHFVKVMKEGYSPDFKHHCHQMQVWFDKVKNITIKPKTKHLTIEQWIDWFFTAGQSIELLIPESYQDEYEILIKELIIDKDRKVIDIISALPDFI